MNSKNKLFQSCIYFIYLVLIISVGLEIMMRVFQPINMRVSSGKVNLPKNQKYLLQNANFTKLTKGGVHKKNAWGFRGENWDPTSNNTKILFVGGSTTECFFSDDKKVWTQQFANLAGNTYLVNNAGLNGHSTVGHIILLEGYIDKIKPDYVFFLAGINDVALTENNKNSFDDELEENNLKKALFWLENKSQLINLLHSLYRSYQAKKIGLADNIEWNLALNEKEYRLSNADKMKLFDKHLAAQTTYRTRLNKLIKICKDAGAVPVFITQPLLFGNAIDSTTGINLGTYKIYGLTGSEYWKKLEIYNNTMRKVAHENSLELIDLAELLPHKSENYYDDMHFSDVGSTKVAEIIYKNWTNKR